MVIVTPTEQILTQLVINWDRLINENPYLFRKEDLYLHPEIDFSSYLKSIDGDYKKHVDALRMVFDYHINMPQERDMLNKSDCVGLELFLAECYSHSGGIWVEKSRVEEIIRCSKRYLSDPTIV